ncbi:MAG: tetratricopeptide repeat protein [Ardenticatenaceae bacterium]|nr:tetratricopeptide repeat protein [Ardenticatenaceae bacterium]MCB8947708.1 tetratricopeptide repeat protein [Ardenticatenaceae bacterium]
MAGNRARFEEALNRGHSHSWDQNWQEAIAEFKVAIEEVANEPAPYAGLGMAYLEMNQLKDALENYKLAARFSRGDVIYLRQVADAQERLGHYGEAGKTYMAIGEVELNRRRLTEAMDNWNRAVRLEPDLLRGHQRLASIYERQGSVHNAIREYLAIARILNSQGKSENALQACQLALKLDPRNAEVLTAIEQIRSGEKLAGESDSPSFQSSDSISEVAQHMAAALQEKSGGASKSADAASPVQDARRLASEKLAEDLFDDEGMELNAKTLQLTTLISKALDFQTRGMTNEAISAYEEAMSLGLDNTAAHFNLGLLYQDKLRFEDAIREFELSVKDHDFRLASYFSLGECHRARGRIEKALEHFINVLKIVDLATVQHSQADRLIELYENLADSLMAQGERDQASAFANALVEFLSHKGWEDKAKEARGRLDAISDSGMMILGDMLTAGSEQVLESLYLSQEYARRGMYDTAVEETYRAIQLSHDYLPAHIQLGELLGKQGRRETAAQKFITVADTYRNRGDVNGAIISYEKSVEMMPLDLAARNRLIDLLKQHGQIDRALEHYLAVGDAYYQLAQIDKARDTYQEALKLAPRGTDEQQWKARLLRLAAEIDMQRFDWRRALTAYKELRGLDPNDERTAITLVDLYYKVGQPVNAVGELDNYLKQLVRSGRGAKVVGILEDMVRQRPSDANLVDRLSRLYIQQKRQADAIELLDKLGEAQLEANETQAAYQTIEKILSLNPPNAASYKQLLAQLRP